MSEALQIRDATEEDLAGLLAIYNDVIATSTAIYSCDPVTLEERHEVVACAHGAGLSAAYRAR